MTHQELVQNLVKPGQDIVDSITASHANLWHMATGISGEVAETLMGMIQMDEANVKEELGDIEFYYEGLCQELDWRCPHDSMTEGVTEEIAPMLVGAAGEVLDSVKKVVIYNTGDIEPVLNSLIMFRHTLDGFYEFCGIERDEVLQMNIEKLTKRYGEKYSDESAQLRLDKV